jgi:hypothetical protein
LWSKTKTVWSLEIPQYEFLTRICMWDFVHLVWEGDTNVKKIFQKCTSVNFSINVALLRNEYVFVYNRLHWTNCNINTGLCRFEIRT